MIAKVHKHIGGWGWGFFQTFWEERQGGSVDPLQSVPTGVRVEGSLSASVGFSTISAQYMMLATHVTALRVSSSSMSCVKNLWMVNSTCPKTK